MLGVGFASCFAQSESQGIPVEAKISVPDTLPVKEGELAIVLANALENAIHANLALPQEKRAIRCKMVGTPSIMLELSNPYTGSISFDSDGLPTTQREGHGLGVQSISASAAKPGLCASSTSKTAGSGCGWCCKHPTQIKMTSDSETDPAP